MVNLTDLNKSFVKRILPLLLKEIFYFFHRPLGTYFLHIFCVSLKSPYPLDERFGGLNLTNLQGLAP
jgi:hypothetical protein